MRPTRGACYIAGPMRGIPEYNYPAFFAAEDALRAANWGPIYNPAKLDIEEADEEYIEHTVEEQELYYTAEAARQFARRDTFVLIERLRAEYRDAIVLLPGWEHSVGAQAERAVAEWVHLRVLLLEEALRDEPVGDVHIAVSPEAIEEVLREPTADDKAQE